MKRNLFVQLRMVAVLLLCGALIFLVGCEISLGDLDRVGETYTVADSFTLDAAPKEIEVHWTAGSVRVEIGSTDQFFVQETSEQMLTDVETMHYSLKEDVLTIEAGAVGAQLVGVRKDLVIALPCEYASLVRLDVDTSSADITVDGIRCETLAASSISGDVSVMGSAEAVVLGNVSGSTVATITGVESLTQGTVSGATTLRLPDLDGYTATFTTVSGALDVDADAVKKDGAYLFGDGEAVVTLSTITGNVSLRCGEE